MTWLPRFRLLPKVHSLRLAGKRYVPGDKIELTEEQAKRFNPDLFVEIAPEIMPAAPAKEPGPTAEAPPTIEGTPAVVVQKPKKCSKRPAFAGSNKP